MIRVWVANTAPRPVRLTKKRRQRTGDDCGSVDCMAENDTPNDVLNEGFGAVGAGDTSLRDSGPEKGGGGVVTVPMQTNGSDDEGDDHEQMFTANGEKSVLREFLKLLSAEVAIDLDKLRDTARHGIPEEVRRDVWKYLLGVLPADRSKEISILKAKAEEYDQIEKDIPEIVKRLRGEATRYMRRVDVFKDSTATIAIFERVIAAYISHNKAAEYYPALVHLCGPFVYVIQKESDVFYCFDRLMSQLEEYYTKHSLQERVATFITLFRSVLPDLYNYFEDEEVDVNDWASTWLEHLLATALPFPCLLRLWDAYFALPDGLDLHVYVCIAILRHCKESLEELEQSEIRTLLLRLPPMDMDQVLNLASNIRWDAYESDR